MSYEIKRLADQPAIVITFNDDFDMGSELATAIPEIMQTVSNEPEPIYAIIDMSRFNMSLNDLFVGTGVGLKNRDNTNRDEVLGKIIKTIIVTDQKVLQASIKGFERFGFGKNLELAASLDEALQIIANAA